MDDTVQNRKKSKGKVSLLDRLVKASSETKDNGYISLDPKLLKSTDTELRIGKILRKR